MSSSRTWMCGLATLGLLAGCGEGGAPAGKNPFLQDQSRTGKDDTAYVNPDGTEVEVDLEGDVEGSEYQVMRGPAEVGQYALTYLRKHGEVYLESLAEAASSDERAEWRVDDKWVTAAELKKNPDLDKTQLKHWRLRAVNAVLLHDASKGVKKGKKLTARVPMNPWSTMGDAGDKCADPDAHLGMMQSIYWYLWNPDKEECKIATQDLTVTVSRTFTSNAEVYPEYDRLVADKKLTVVVLFGQIGDGEISEWDTGMVGARTMASWLEDAGFKEVKSAPVGRRFSKKLESGVTAEFDLYSPKEFSGLGDYEHFKNFEKAIAEHEIVVYDGHSMLGASDFWAKPKYPAFYQIFLYGGCLGYEYYVAPILAGKKSWRNVDILSSVVEVSAGANEFAAPALAKILWALDNDYRASWADLLGAVREGVGDSTFGVSGVRDNCFTPDGSRCDEPTPP